MAGRLAARCGLAGAVDAQHFARLSEGQNPLTGEQLVRSNNTLEYTNAAGESVKPVEHRAGWDATFSAPKSVSLSRSKKLWPGRGFSGPEAAEISGHNSRDKKQIHTPSEVIAAHRQIAGEFGHQADKVVAEARSRGVHLDRVPDAPKRAQEAVTYARDRSFEREAVTDQRMLLRDALRRGMGDVTYRNIRTNFDQRHAAREFQTVPGQKHATGQQFTTR